MKYKPPQPQSYSAETAVLITQLKDRIKRLEEMYEGEPGERPDLLGSNVMGLLKRELIGTQKRIKRLEEAGDAMTNCIACGCNDGGCTTCRGYEEKWAKAKEAKL